MVSIVADDPKRSWFHRKIATWSDVPERVFDERIRTMLAFFGAGTLVLGGALVVYVIAHFVSKFW